MGNRLRFFELSFARQERYLGILPFGGATAEHLSVMGYQDRGLEDWRLLTFPALVAVLRDRQADGLILAPA